MADEIFVPTTLIERRYHVNLATESARLLERLRETHLVILPERTNDDFFELLIEPMRRKTFIDTDRYVQHLAEANNRTHDTAGKKLESFMREAAVRFVCFQAACANCIEAEHRAPESPNAAWSYLIDGWYWLGCMAGRCSIESALRQSAKGAEAKLAADPKQADKGLVRECWDDWQKRPDRYKGKAAFARDMLSKYESLENANVIARWCRAWQKEHGTQQA